MKNQIYLLSLTCFFLCLNFSAHAFRFSPMSAALDITQTDRLLFTLENDSDSPIAVELTLRGRVPSLTGEETQPELTDLPVSIFPEQVIIPAKEKRSARVSWTGKTPPPQELPLRLIAEQLPIDLSKEENAEQGGIKVMMRYVAALYINPGKTKSDIQVDSFTLSSEGIKATLINKGSRHQILTNASLVFTSTKDRSKKIELSAEVLKQLQGENLLPGFAREFLIPHNDQTKQINTDYQLSLTLND